MLNFAGMLVPGSNWVEIVNIREKDGAPLAADNWRHKLFGQITRCWIAGGFRQRGAVFTGKIRMENGNPVVIDLYDKRWTSTTNALPIEVEPGIFDFETNTCIYRFRMLTEEEEMVVNNAIEKAVVEELERRSKYLAQMAQSPAAANGDGPVS